AALVRVDRPDLPVPDGELRGQLRYQIGEVERQLALLLVECSLGRDDRAPDHRRVDGQAHRDLRAAGVLRLRRGGRDRVENALGAATGQGGGGREEGKEGGCDLHPTRLILPPEGRIATPRRR